MFARGARSNDSFLLEFSESSDLSGGSFGDFPLIYCGNEFRGTDSECFGGLLDCATGHIQHLGGGLSCRCENLRICFNRLGGRGQPNWRFLTG